MCTPQKMHVHSCQSVCAYLQLCSWGLGKALPLRKISNTNSCSLKFSSINFWQHGHSVPLCEWFSSITGSYKPSDFFQGPWPDRLYVIFQRTQAFNMSTVCLTSQKGTKTYQIMLKYSILCVVPKDPDLWLNHFLFSFRFMLKFKSLSFIYLLKKIQILFIPGHWFYNCD